MTALVATAVRLLVADADEFRAWVGAADQAEALARVYVAGVDEGSYVRPFALVLTSAHPASRRVAGGSRDRSEQSGAVEVLLEADVSSSNASSIQGAYVAFLNNVGGIVTGMEEVAGTEGHPHVRRIQVHRVPQRSDEDEGDDYMQAVLTVEWGI